MLLTPGMPLVARRITSWKISEAEDIPKLRRLYWNRPACVLKVVMYQDEGSSSSCWYPDLKSSFEYTIEPLKSCISSSIVGHKCRSREIALFAWRISTQSRISSGFFLGGVTMGDTHGVGVLSTLSIMSCCKSLFSSFSTLLRKWNGVLLYLCNRTDTLTYV